MNKDIEEKKFKDINSLKCSITNIDEIISYFKDENTKSKKKHEKFNKLSTLLKPVDTFVIIGTTLTSVTLSITGLPLIVMPPTGVACGLSFGVKII